jgi:hypothetical protein
MNTTRRSDAIRPRLTATITAFGVLLSAASAGAQTPGMTQAPGPGPAAAPAPAAPPPGAPAPQAPQQYQQYPQYPAPPYATAPNGQYVAPLSQTVQPVYVPQSVALSGPRFIKDWRDGDAIPWGYHREERVRKGAIISGSILFGITYGYSLLIATLGEDISSGDNGAAPLAIPVLGPFITLKNSDSASLNYILVLDGLAQAAGAALMIHGIVSPKALLVRNDLGVAFVPAPMGKDGTGMMMMGRF